MRLFDAASAPPSFHRLLRARPGLGPSLGYNVKPGARQAGGKSRALCCAALAWAWGSPSAGARTMDGGGMGRQRGPCRRRRREGGGRGGGAALCVHGIAGQKAHLVFLATPRRARARAPLPVRAILRPQPPAPPLAPLLTGCRPRRPRLRPGAVRRAAVALGMKRNAARVVSAAAGSRVRPPRPRRCGPPVRVGGGRLLVSESVLGLRHPARAAGKRPGRRVRDGRRLPAATPPRLGMRGSDSDAGNRSRQGVGGEGAVKCGVGWVGVGVRGEGGGGIEMQWEEARVLSVGQWAPSSSKVQAAGFRIMTCAAGG